MSSFEIQSSAFGANQPIPRQYTAEGINISPPLQWNTLPPGTQELALIVDDPDAPQTEPWVHWVLYKIAPQVARLPEGIPPSQRISEPGGAMQGRNSWGRIGYGGPQPPKGHGVHHYHFKLYALEVKLDLHPGVEIGALVAAMQGHILAQTECIGTFER